MSSSCDSRGFGNGPSGHGAVLIGLPVGVAQAWVLVACWGQSCPWCADDLVCK